MAGDSILICLIAGWGSALADTREQGEITRFFGDFSLRPVAREDLPTLMEIESQVSPFPWTAKQFSDSIKGHQGVVLVKSDEIVSYLFFYRILDQAELLNIAVAPDFQGHGLGSRLLKYCLDQLREYTQHLHLEVRASNFPAIALYLRNGFKQVGERRGYYRDGDSSEDALLMVFDFHETGSLA